MKITINAKPKEIAALIDEVQRHQRPIEIWGPGMQKWVDEHPDFLTSDEVHQAADA